MAMEIKLYKSSKRKNSTAIPSDGVTVNVTLKGGSSILRPTLYLNVENDGYNMLKMNGRYYWISDWSWERNDLAKISAVIDPLSSWKNEILATSAYVLYSTSSYSTMLQDNRLMTRSDTTRSNWAGDNLLVFDTDGSYIVGVIGKPNRPSASGMTTVYSLTARQCSDLAVAFSEDDAIKQLINEYGAAWDALIFSRWIPVKVSGEDASISIANVNTGITGKQINQRYESTTFQVRVPWKFSDYRKVEPFSEGKLFLPYVGVVDIALSAISDVDLLLVSCCIDKYTGDIVYKVGASSNQLAVYSGNCAIEIPINSYQRDWKGVVQNGVSAAVSFASALKQVPAAVATAMAGGVPSGPNFDGTVGNFVSAVESYFTFNTGSKGGFSGGAGSALGYKPMMTVIAHNTSAEPSTMGTLYGRPCGQVKNIGSLSGFVQTAEFKVAGTMTEHEKSMIEAYMRGGVYIE